MPDERTLISYLIKNDTNKCILSVDHLFNCNNAEVSIKYDLPNEIQPYPNDKKHFL
mgnify:CR=1 FL=1